MKKTMLMVAASAILCEWGGAGAAAADGDPAMGYRDARHFLERTGFAPAEATVREFAPMSRTEAIAKVLAETRRVAGVGYPAWAADRKTEIAAFRAQRDLTPEERRPWLQEQLRNGFDLRAWWFHEMATTSSPLTERMTLFWHNHFVSSQAKVRFTLYLLDQNILLREHALGNFGSMLKAIARDPAMLLYLDGVQNRRAAPNENFAREVMELFTLGEGHYSEADVKEAARAFTGWGLDRDTGTFRFYRGQHDADVKSVLGTSGRLDGDSVLDILLRHPQTATFITRKLWREFVSPDPDATEVAAIARTLRESGYEIRSALAALLATPSFWSEMNRATLVKSPVELVVGTLRQFDIRTDDYVPFAVAAAGMGQNVFAAPNVKGWPGGEAWVNSQTLLARKQFLERLFRTEERSPAMTAGRSQDAMTEPLVLDERRRQAQIARRVERGMREVRFDSSRFAAQFSDRPDRDAALLRLVHPMPAVRRPEAADTLGLIREAVLDPVYQLK